MPGLISSLRSLLVGTVFAAIALAVAVGVWRTDMRGQTESPATSVALGPGTSTVRDDTAEATVISAPLSRDRIVATAQVVSEPEENRSAPSAVLPPLPPADPPVKAPAPRGGSPSNALPIAPPPSVRDTYDGSGNLAQETTEADPITIDADFSSEWKEGEDQIAVLRGRCRIVQGRTTVYAQKVVVWRRDESSFRVNRDRLRVYLEDDVVVDRPGKTVSERSLFLDLVSRKGVTYNVSHRGVDQPAPNDDLFRRASARKRATSRLVLDPTQLVVPGSTGGPAFRSVQIQSPAGNVRRVRVFPRYGLPYNVLSFESKETSPPEQIWLLTGGINIVVDGVEQFGTVDLSADRMVIWTRPGTQGDFQAETVQTRETPFQVYLEGNVVVRQGQNVLRAAQGVYDAREDRALMHDAELRTFIPQLQGDIRLRAQSLRQISKGRFYAQHAWGTTSQTGKPGYRFESREIFIEPRISNWWFGAGSEIDPLTGMPEEVPWFTALNTRFYIEDVPVLYLPKVSGPAKDPNIPIRTVTGGSDRIFGTFGKITWDLHTLFGIDSANGNQWDLYTDYYTDRGFGIGTGGKYRGVDDFGIPGRYDGEGIGYFINDGGDDNLGRDRRSIPPEKQNRYRATIRHRHRLPYNVDVIAELGLLSDRNFLEQFWENEFDEGKDQETLIYAKQQVENRAITGMFRAQVNDFENTTEWLPRGDLYVLGEPLFDGNLLWSTHTSAGYARLLRADAPSSPQEAFTPIPFITNSDGAVLMSRHELSAPFDLGPISIVPYALGEGAFWSETINDNDVGRLVGRLGIRGSMFAQRVYPHVNSRMFNLNGLAHKMVFEASYAYTDSSEPFANIPQYNEIDDNAQERLRQRLVTRSFGGLLPPQLEPRFYAIRHDVGASVTDPYHELIDDQQVARFAWRHRLQTKVGPPGRMRIRDWMRFDVEGAYFPDAGRDNFGEEFGQLTGRYEWLLSSRTTFFANAQYDFFDNASQLWDLGIRSQRSERGYISFVVRQVKAARIDSQILGLSYSYQMSPKWISTLSTGYDLGEGRNVGQALTITRIGSDFLVHVGANFDQSKDNVGLAIAVEPRLGNLNQSNFNSLLRR